MKYKTKDIVIGVLSVAVVVLLIFMIAGNSNGTGNAFFDFFKAKEVGETGMEQTQTNPSTFTQGLLADAYLAKGGSKDMLKGYEAKYDENGDLIYEVVEEGTKIVVGEGTTLVQDPENPLITAIYSGGIQTGVKACVCKKTSCTLNSCSATQGGARCGGICERCGSPPMYGCEFKTGIQE